MGKDSHIKTEMGRGVLVGNFEKNPYEVPGELFVVMA